MTSTATAEALTPGITLKAKADIQAINPKTQEAVGIPWRVHTATDLQHMAALSGQAFDAFRTVSVASRVKLIRDIAKALEAKKDDILAMAELETAYVKAPRLQGEFGRMLYTARGIADRLERGEIGTKSLTARNDPGRLLREELVGANALPDLSLEYEALGPVLDIESSNFPFAFGVFGTNSATALALGNTVIAKVCTSHPNTSALIGSIVRGVINQPGSGIPTNSYQLMFGTRDEINYLVNQPAIQCVTITGSRQASDSLRDLIRTRAAGEIPLYAENGSVNPYIILPSAVSDAAKVETEATAFFGSNQLCVGQFCTNPGVILLVNSPHSNEVVDALSAKVRAAACGTMLSEKIRDAYVVQLKKLRGKGAMLIAESEAEPNAAATQARPTLLEVDAATLIKDPSLGEEAFGPSALIVRVELSQVKAVLKALGGQLTTTIRADKSEAEIVTDLVQASKQTAGRVIVNGVPTGVDVSNTIVHGGPYPATSDGRTTSVGFAKEQWLRFVRPVSVQGLEEFLA